MLAAGSSREGSQRQVRMHDSAPPKRPPFQRSFVILLSSLFALTFLKGFRFPGLWTATHFAFNYSQGFVRRGLVGEVFRRLFGDDVYKYNNFLLFAFALMALWAVLLAMGIRRALRTDPDDWGFRVALLTFAASPGLVFFVHAVGYLDYIGVVVVLAFLFWAKRTKRYYAPYYAMLAICLVLLLVHEGLVVMFAPSLLFILLCQAARRSQHHELSKRTWLLHAGHALLAIAPILGLAFALSTSGTGDGQRAHALADFMRRHADFVVHPEALKTLTRSSRENMTVIVPWYWRQSETREIATKGLIAFVPGFSFILYYGVRSILRLTLPFWLRAVLSSTFLAAVVSPELMNFAGWDWPRWNGIAIMQAISCIMAVKILLPQGKPAQIPHSLLSTGLVLAAVGLASTTMLFDNYKVQFFPFDKQFEFLMDVFDGHFSYRPRA